MRGPIGGHFVWEAAMGGPLLLVGGGSGIVPLMSMIRHRAAAGSAVPARLLYSSRTQADIIYREELKRLAKGGAGLEVVHTLTRAQPPGWAGYRRRVDADMLRAVAWPADQRPLVYICGPSSFAWAVATGLVALGHDPRLVKAEDFGPTGQPEGEQTR